MSTVPSAPTPVPTHPTLRDSRSESPSTAEPIYRYRFASVEFDESTGVLRVEGLPAVVEPLPLQLLVELLRRPNEVVTRAELFDALWDSRPTVDHVLSNAVGKLRRALGEDGAARIINLPRIGYRLAGPIERIAVGRVPGSVIELVAGQAVPGRPAFRLERALGAATQRNVWLARDARLGQSRVFKFASDGDRLASLKREYTVYRVLRHELGERNDFAVVLGANFVNAPYFLECEYGGEDMPHWATESDRLKAMAMPERVALLLQIARAVAAAHSVGVLHKDLKPANVLIDKGEAGWIGRLTDFGISRILDPARLAQIGVTAMGLTVTQNGVGDSPLGTLLYLAPELLAGHSPTMKSDLYALGLMLYQVLVGDFRRPMSTGWERDIDDPLLRADIAAATEGRPEDRLSGVTEFVDRLQALDQRRTDLAQRERANVHAAALAAALQRTRMRRPWLMGAFVCLVLGLAASLWSYRQAERSRQHAEQEAARAQTINDFLNQDVLQSADVTELGPTKSFRITDMMERASQKAASRFAGNPLTEAEVRTQLGEVYYKMAAPNEAEKESRRANVLFGKSTGEPNVKSISAQYLWAKSLVALSKPKDAWATIVSADRNAAGLGLPAHPGLALAAARARELYFVHVGRYADAMKEGVAAVSLIDRLEPDNFSARFVQRRALAEIYFRAGDMDHLAQILATMMVSPYSPETVGEIAYARGQIQVARLDSSQGAFDAAQAVLLKARATISDRMGANDPIVGSIDEELGIAYQAQGQFGLAREAFKRSYANSRSSLGEDNPQTRTLALSGTLVDTYDGKATSSLRQLELQRPWFVANMGGGTSPIVQMIDFYRVRSMLDLGSTAEAAAILSTLKPEQLAIAESSIAWPLILQGEEGILWIASGKKAAGLERLVAVDRALADKGESPIERRRYDRAISMAKTSAPKRIGA